MVAFSITKDSGPKLSTLVFSRGKAFERVYQFPYDIPSGSEAFIQVTDNAGGVLALFEGEVGKRSISFLEVGPVVDSLPHGCNFEFWVVYADIGEPIGVAYGTVIRKEPSYPLATVVDPEASAKQYTANFIGEYIGPMWRPMGNGLGSLGIHTQVLISQDPSMGPNFSFFTEACARWLWPMNMDSVTINVKVINVGAGKFNVIVCGDYTLETYLGIQFETGLINNKVHVITGDGPLEVDYQGSPVNNTVANGDVYQVKYNFLSNKIALYKGTSLTPLIEWEDTGHLVPHGEGFRYVGLSWSTSLFTPGVEPTAWEAKDGV